MAGSNSIAFGPTGRRGVRCAIYTRKSSEEGLEQEFNSLDAQREACAAYIASQRSEGWVELAEQYDDGGVSGGTLERPALKRLLADIDGVGRQPPGGVHRVEMSAHAAERLAHATPADALKHPNWAMGPKITVDSATLANKGLELIEARWLFGLRPEQCHAVIHPQSIVHAVVEFADGAFRVAGTDRHEFRPLADLTQMAAE